MRDLNIKLFTAGGSKGVCAGSSLVPKKWLERNGRHSGVRITAGHRHITQRQAQSKDLRRSTRLPPTAHLATTSVCFCLLNCRPKAIFNCLHHYLSPSYMQNS